MVVETRTSFARYQKKLLNNAIGIPRMKWFAMNPPYLVTPKNKIKNRNVLVHHLGRHRSRFKMSGSVVSWVVPWIVVSSHPKWAILSTETSTAYQPNESRCGESSCPSVIFLGRSSKYFRALSMNKHFLSDTDFSCAVGSESQTSTSMLCLNQGQ